MKIHHFLRRPLFLGKRYCSTSSFAQTVQQRITSENKLVAGGSTLEERRIPCYLLRGKNIFTLTRLQQVAPGADDKYYTHMMSDDSVLLGDAHDFFRQSGTLLGIENMTTDDPVLAPFGLLQEFDDKYTESTENFDYGAGLSCWTDGTICARLNTHWYLLQEGAVLPEGIAIVKDREDGHRSLTNLSSMKKSKFIEKMSEFEKENWKCVFKIHNIPAKCAKALSDGLKSEMNKFADYCSVGSDKLTVAFDAYFKNEYKHYEKMPAAATGGHFSQISDEIHFSYDSQIYALSVTLLQLAQASDQRLLDAVFAANPSFFDEKFKESFFRNIQKIPEISARKQTSVTEGRKKPIGDHTIHKTQKSDYHVWLRGRVFLYSPQYVIADLIAKKVCDLKSFNVNVPLNLVNHFRENFEYCQNYPLPIVVNKEWLLLTLGFRGLEKQFEYFYDIEEITDAPIMYQRMTKSCKQLEMLYDKFLSITSDMIDLEAQKTPNKEGLTKLDAPLRLYDGTMITSQQMDTITALMGGDLSCDEKKAAVGAIREGFYLNQLCNFIFSMRDDGLDDGYQIKCDKIFSQDDIDKVRQGVTDGLETAFMKLGEVEHYSLSEICRKLVATLQESVSTHHARYNNLPFGAELY